MHALLCSFQFSIFYICPGLCLSLLNVILKNNIISTLKLFNMELIDFRSYNWDDTELIKAYDRGMEARNAKKKEKNDSGAKDNKRRKWKVGDYCRAIYPEDKSYYEAKVISLNGDFCTIEFLGYGDTEDVDFFELKESEGKKARRKQIKESKADSYDYNGSLDESETGGETTDATVASYSSYRKKKQHVNQTANNATYDTTLYETTIHQQYPAVPPAAYYAPPAPMPTSMPFMAPPATMPQYPMPPAPPMPQCPSIANNPSISSMLTSWYMAGYYTGLHSAQKENRGCQRCCSHSSSCCRN